MRNLVLLLSVAALPLVVVATASATQPVAATSTAHYLTRTVDAQRTTGPNTFVEVTNTGTVSGAFNGSFVEHVTIKRDAGGGVSFHGTSTCSCTVDGRTGTAVFAIEGSGTVGPPLSITGHGSLVDATDGLAGLHAEFDETRTGPLAALTGSYHFEP